MVSIRKSTEQGPDSADARGWSPRRWAGFGAAAAALSFAAVNVGWALGAQIGLATLGGRIEELARAGDPRLLRLNLLAAGLKVGGAVLALALVQSWGRHVPRRLLLVSAWVGAVVLVLYGVLQITGLVLAALGITERQPSLTSQVLWWRLLFWEPWFLVWGLLLGAVVWPKRIPETETSRSA